MFVTRRDCNQAEKQAVLNYRTRNQNHYRPCDCLLIGNLIAAISLLHAVDETRRWNVGLVYRLGVAPPSLWSLLCSSHASGSRTVPLRTISSHLEFVSVAFFGTDCAAQIRLHMRHSHSAAGGRNTFEQDSEPDPSPVDLPGIMLKNVRLIKIEFIAESVTGRDYI